MKQNGFTIVELLIVVVVIAILAAITIVSFNGIQERAIRSSIQSTLASAAKKAESLKALSSAEDYPTDITLLGITSNGNTTYNYNAANTAYGKSFCIVGTHNDMIYSISNTSTLNKGRCSDNGLQTYMNAADISGVVNGGAVAAWNDLSGKGNAFTQPDSTKRPTYQSAGPDGVPALLFDGAGDALVQPFAFTGGGAFTVFAMVYSTETTATYRNVFEIDTATRPMLWWNTTGRIEADRGDTGVTSTTAHRNIWTKIALSHPGGNAKAQLYVDGTQYIDSDTYTVPAATPSWFNRGGGQTWQGYVSQIRVYNKALSAAEVMSL